MLRCLSLSAVACIKFKLSVIASERLMKLIIKFIFCISVSIFAALFFVVTSRESSNDNYYSISSSTVKNNSEVPETCDATIVPVMFGEIEPDRKYAVFSATSDKNKQSYDFLFLLPLTAMAWKRVGFDSLVIIVGSVTEWTFDPLRYIVLNRLRQLNAVIIYLKVPPVNSVMVSQVRNMF